MGLPWVCSLFAHHGFAYLGFGFGSRWWRLWVAVCLFLFIYLFIYFGVECGMLMVDCGFLWVAGGDDVRCVV